MENVSEVCGTIQVTVNSLQPITWWMAEAFQLLGEHWQEIAQRIDLTYLSTMRESEGVKNSHMDSFRAGRCRSSLKVETIDVHWIMWNWPGTGNHTSGKAEFWRGIQDSANQRRNSQAEANSGSEQSLQDREDRAWSKRSTILWLMGSGNRSWVSHLVSKLDLATTSSGALCRG